MEYTFYEHGSYTFIYNLTQPESIVMTDCDINSLTADFSKLQDLVWLGLGKNNLKEIL